MTSSISLDLANKAFGTLPPLQPGDYINAIYLHWGGNCTGEPNGYKETLAVAIYATEHAPGDSAELSNIPVKLFSANIKPIITTVDATAGNFAAVASLRIPLPWLVDRQTRRLAVSIGATYMSDDAAFVTVDYSTADE